MKNSIDHPTYLVCSPSYIHHQQRQQSIHIHRIRWNFPPRGCLKLNTDGSSFRGSASFGGVIRDGSGRWICGYMGKIPGTNTTSLMAEIWGIYKGLLLIKDIGFKKVFIETDCTGALDIFSRLKLEQNHPQKDMIEDGRKIMKEFECVIVHTLREGNHCADQIAKLGRRQPEEFCFLEDVPDAAIPFLLADAAGVGFERPARRQHKV